MMRDPRIDEYARLLVDRSVAVQPGWQVFVRATPLARPLLDAVQEQIARRGAYPILQLAWETVGGPFAREAPLDLLARPAPLLRAHLGGVRRVHHRSPRPRTPATDRTSPPSGGSSSQQRIEPLRRRQMAMEVPWVICEYPTNAAAQEAGMQLERVRGVRLRRRAARLGCGGERMARDRGGLRRRRGGADRRRGNRSDALARRPLRARSTTGTSTCRAARSSTRRSRTRSRGWSRSASSRPCTSGTRSRASGSSSSAAAIVEATRG